MTEAANVRTFDNIEAGVQVAAVLVEDIPVKTSEEEEATELTDLWFFFISIYKNDCWVGYCIADSMNGEPDRSLANSNLDELKRLSVLVGDSWEEIEKNHQAASLRHRRVINDLDDETKEAMMSMSFAEVQERRAKIDFEGVRTHWRKFPMVLSLN